MKVIGLWDECGVYPALWFPAYAGMTVWCGFAVFTLTFDSSPIKGEGESVDCVVLLSPRPVDTALKPV